jgi:large subunit ribosomal protein L22
MDPGKLYISHVSVSPGPTLKRFHARARGRGARVLKRTSHVTLVMAEKE